MKRVILMRHAKSNWDNPTLTDHQRVLNPRGRRDAPQMADRIVNHGIIPELILVSDATRTQETWQLVSPALGNAQTKFDKELYLASSSTIISKLMKLDNLIDTVMLLAHNPGITEVFYDLAGVSIDNVPTAGVGCIQFNCDKFSELLDCKKELIYFDYPKLG